MNIQRVQSVVRQYGGVQVLMLLLVLVLVGCSRQPTATLSPLASPLPTLVSPLASSTVQPGVVLPGRLVFHSTLSGNYDIYVVNGNGQGLRQLTSHAGRDIEPVWSPDGEMIVFASDRDDPSGLNLYVMLADGSEQRPLVQHAGYALSASWSPDGQRLVFHANWEGRFQLYTVSAQGGSPSKLFDIEGNAYMPDWSPDGSRIAFVGDQDGGNDDIYYFDLNTGEITRVTDDYDRDIRPRWSPDGTRLVYQHYEGEDISIVVYDLATGSLVPLSGANDTYQDSMPVWVGNDTILCSSRIDEQPWEFHVLGMDGTRRVFMSTDEDLRYPQWTAQEG